MKQTRRREIAEGEKRKRGGEHRGTGGQPWGSRGRERRMQRPEERACHLAPRPVQSEPRTEAAGG